MNNQQISPFTDAAMTAFEAKVAELKESMPIKVGLSATDRKSLYTCGSRSTQFTQRSDEAYQAMPEIAPLFVNAESLTNSYLAYNQLGSMLGTVDQLQRIIADNMIIAGCNAFSSARDFYNSAKRAAKSGVPGAQAVVDTLKPRFQKSKQPKAPTTDAPLADQPAG